MSFKNVVIDSFDYAEPEVFISSEDFEKKLKPVYERLKLPEGRLELQTGVLFRGMWKSGTKPSEIASIAAKKTLAKTKISHDDIDLLIYAGVCRDFLEPSTASYVHKNLELKPTCISFDLSNACLGFINAMDLASKQIEAGVIKSALIVTGENSGPLIEETIKKLNEDFSLTRKTIKKYIANLTIGSAGVAFLLSHKDLSSSKMSIDFCYGQSNTRASSLCQGNGSADGLMMETESTELLSAGIELAKSTWFNFLKINELDTDEIDHFISHQVGVAHSKLLFNELGLDTKKDFITYDKYGNTGSAAVPLTFIKAFNANRFKSSDKVAFLGIGSGLHSIMMRVTC